MGFPQGDDLKEWLQADVLDAQLGQDTSPTANGSRRDSHDTPGESIADEIEKRLRKMRLSKEEERTILILNSASPALSESDFYRIANQGRHVDGWAVGLSKGASPSSFSSPGTHS